MSVTIIDASGTTTTIDTTLNIYSIEQAIRSLEVENRRRHDERKDAQRSQELRVERQRLVAKIQRTGLRVRTQEQEFSKYGWDVELERKTHQHRAQAGSSYRVNFRPEVELEGVVKLRVADGISFGEAIIDSLQFGFSRQYSVALSE